MMAEQDIAGLIDQLHACARQINDAAKTVKFGETLRIAVTEPQYLYAHLVAAASMLAFQQAEIERLQAAFDMAGDHAYRVEERAIAAEARCRRLEGALQAARLWISAAVDNGPISPEDEISGRAMLTEIDALLPEHKENAR